MFGAGREEVLVESKSWFAAKPYDWLGLNSAAFGLSVEQRMDCGLIRLEVAVARSRDESAWPSWRGAREVASMFLRCVEQSSFWDIFDAFGPYTRATTPARARSDQNGPTPRRSEVRRTVF